MKKLNLKYPLIVEGKYDKIKLSNVISSPIITVGGFSILNDKKKRKHLSSLAEKTKLIVLTDSDKAGGFIRSRLKGIVPASQLINLYIPQIKGKEKRKNAPSAENLLGVEGMTAELLFELLSPYTASKENIQQISTADFWDAGLSGKSGSTEKRAELAKYLKLPCDLSPKALIDAINSMGGKELFVSALNAIQTEASETTAQTEASETTAQTEASEATAQTEASETATQTEASETTAQTEASETTAPTEASETATQTEASETATQTEASETAIQTEAKSENTNNDFVKSNTENCINIEINSENDSDMKKETENYISKETNGNKTVSFYTLGCRVNQYETRGIAEQLFNSGFSVVPFGEPCDVAFINTCAVTAESERKSLVAIKKGANASKHVIVAGCYSEHKPEKVKGIKNVSFVVGCKEKERCVGAAKELLSLENSFSPLSICHAPPKSFPFVSGCRAYVKIQDGCNGNCTYCLIHKLRGRSVSRPIEDIMEEISRLEKAGYKEIILTGIESSAFGTKNLVNLIEEIGKSNGIKRIRLGSLDPNILTDEFISCIKNTESFMPHLHLSVQSPDSRILRLMKRPYNGEKLSSRIEALREAIPEIMLSADIITSFPTEATEEFEKTLEFVRKYNLLHVHAFSFSPRPGTEAHDMGGRIPKEEAKERNLRLIEVSKEIKTNILQKKIGVPEEILIESFDGKYFKGHTRDFAEALVECENGNQFSEGEIISAIPIKTDGEYIICQKI